jgi:hypothetical protein
MNAENPEESKNHLEVDLKISRVKMKSEKKIANIAEKKIIAVGKVPVKEVGMEEIKINIEKENIVMKAKIVKVRFQKIEEKVKVL